MTALENIEAEQALIGAILINPDEFAEVTQFLKKDDFSIWRNKWVWAAFERLADKKMPIEYLTTVSELKGMKLLREIGGDAYITSMITACPDSTNAITYGKIVAELSQRRKLIASATLIANEAHNTAKPIEDVVANCIANIQDTLSIKDSSFKSLDTLLLEHEITIKEMADKKDASLGIMTHLVDVDKMLGFGLQKKFMILAGRPGVGKTSLAIQIALEAVKQGKHVAIFSLEMDSAQLMNVMMSMLTKIDSQRLALGRLDADEWDRYRIESENLGKLADRLHIFTVPSATPQYIKTMCMNLKMREPLDLVIVDYLLLMGGYDNKMEEHVRANKLTIDLVKVKSELGCAFIVIHHMNRSIEHRADADPILSDLNEGGEIAPDIVAFLYKRKDAVTPAGLIQVRLTFAKHRNGPTGFVDLLFNGPYTWFMSAASRYITLKGKDE